MHAMLMLTDELDSFVRHERWKTDSSTLGTLPTLLGKNMLNTFSTTKVNCIKLIIIGERTWKAA